MTLTLNKRIRKDIDTMNLYKKTCDDDLQFKIQEARRKNELIQRKLITVFGKFEEYLTSEVGRGVNKAEHDALNSRY